MKKIISIVLAAAMTIGVAGCGASKSVPQTNETLTIAHSLRVLDSEYIDAFKKTHPNVEVTIQKPSNIDDPAETETFYQKLFTDMMAGKGPDLLYISSGFYAANDINKMVKAGAFADMTPFIEADTDFNPADYNQAVMQFGVYDNKRYIMPAAYNLPIYLTTQSLVDKTGFDPSKCTDFFELTQQLVEASKSGIAPLSISAASNPIRYFYQTTGLNLVDIDTKTVNLDEQFRRGAEAVKQLGSVAGFTNDNYYYGYQAEQLRDEETILADSSYMSCCGLFEKMRFLDYYEQAPIIVPLRDEQGKIHGTFANGCIISNNSPNQQNAYDFIKIVLSKEFQDGIENNWVTPIAIPVRNDAVDVALKNMSQPISVTNMTGSTWTNLDGITEETAQQYRDILADVVDIRGNDKIQSEIHKMLTPYYDGTQTYEQVEADIKNAMEIYVSE